MFFYFGNDNDNSHNYNRNSPISPTCDTCQHFPNGLQHNARTEEEARFPVKAKLEKNYYKNTKLAEDQRKLVVAQEKNNSENFAELREVFQALSRSEQDIFLMAQLKAMNGGEITASRRLKMKTRINKKTFYY